MISSADHSGSWLIVDREPGPHTVSQDGVLEGGAGWVQEDRRRSGYGTRLLEAAEAAARDRGCTQIFVSSFTFQAPGFYQRHGYVETGRSEGIPTAGNADVHMVKALAPDVRGSLVGPG